MNTMAQGQKKTGVYEMLAHISIGFFLGAATFTIANDIAKMPKPQPIEIREFKNESIKFKFIDSKISLKSEPKCLYEVIGNSKRWNCKTQGHWHEI